jgi:hypothetical protein
MLDNDRKNSIILSVNDFSGGDEHS